jgi:hypothetical protein
MTPKYPSRSTAARTKMLTACKRCGKSNDNGYQYCTACHKEHKGRNGSKSTPRAAQVSAVSVAEVSSSIRDGVLKVLGNDGSILEVERRHTGKTSSAIPYGLLTAGTVPDSSAP